MSGYLVDVVEVLAGWLMGLGVVVGVVLVAIGAALERTVRP
jgi:hypothetical protein